MCVYEGRMLWKGQLHSPTQGSQAGHSGFQTSEGTVRGHSEEDGPPRAPDAGWCADPPGQAQHPHRCLLRPLWLGVCVPRCWDPVPTPGQQLDASGSLRKTTCLKRSRPLPESLFQNPLLPVMTSQFLKRQEPKRTLFQSSLQGGPVHTGLGTCLRRAALRGAPGNLGWSGRASQRR